MIILFSFVLLISIICYANGANILFLATVTSPSHHFWKIKFKKKDFCSFSNLIFLTFRLSTLSYALAARGHNITYLSPDKDKNVVKNMHFIQLEGLYEGAYLELVKGFFHMEHLPPYLEPFVINDVANPICERK